MPGAPLFTIRTTESGKLVNVEAVIKVNSELWSFFPSNVNVRPALRRKAPEEVQYTPGVSNAPPNVKKLFMDPYEKLISEVLSCAG